MKTLNRIFPLLIVLLLLCGCTAEEVSTTVTADVPVSEDIAEEITEAVPQEPTVSRIVFAGDIIGHMTILHDASNGQDENFDFSHIYGDATEQLQSADYAVANLESPLGGGPYSGYPSFNAPDALASGAQDAGIDLFSTANNHTRDSGVNAIIRTLDVLDEIGAAHVGTYRSQAERDENHGVYVADVGGISVAFLCYTYGLNGYSIPSEQPYLVNIFNTDYTTTLCTPDYTLLDADFAYARSLNADLIAVLVHWGVEYQDTENSYQEEMASYFVSQGADMVIGGHPHVLQPYETVTATGYDGTERSGFVIYSLGNFISNQPNLAHRTTVLLELELTRDNEAGTASISAVSYTPYYMYFRGNASYGDKTSGWGTQRILLDTHKAIAAYESGEGGVVTASVYEQLQDSLAHCHKVLGEAGDSYLQAADTAAEQQTSAAAK